MFKFFKKDNLSQSSDFWRWAIIIFGLGLLLVFAGQVLMMLVLGGSGSNLPTSLPHNNLANNVDSQKASQLLKELNDRSVRLKDILATTTVFVDPSL